jgi:WD40 repeat protein
VLCSERQLCTAALSTNGRWLAASTIDGVVRCWRVSDARLVAQFAVGGLGKTGAVAVSADGSTLAVACARRSVQLYALPGGQLVSSIAVGRSATCLAFTADRSKLAIGTAVGRVSLWDVASRQLVGELAALDVPLQALVISPDAHVLATAGRDGSLWLRRILATSSPQRAQPRPSAALGMIGSGQRLFDWLRRVALL